MDHTHKKEAYYKAYYISTLAHSYRMV